MLKEVDTRPFDVDGTKHIAINGKSFYLLRAYVIRYDKFIFVQVFGRSALTKDDLPEKNWEIVVTKGTQGQFLAISRLITQRSVVQIHRGRRCGPAAGQGGGRDGRTARARGRGGAGGRSVDAVLARELLHFLSVHRERLERESPARTCTSPAYTCTPPACTCTPPARTRTRPARTRTLLARTCTSAARTAHRLRAPAHRLRDPYVGRVL
jgi:hypothetical protein